MKAHRLLADTSSEIAQVCILSVPTMIAQHSRLKNPALHLQQVPAVLAVVYDGL